VANFIIELSILLHLQFFIFFSIFLLTAPPFFDNIILQDSKYIDITSSIDFYVTLGLLIYKSDPPQ